MREMPFRVRARSLDGPYPDVREPRPEPPNVHGSGFRVEGLRFRVSGFWGVGFRVLGVLACRV